MEKTTVLMNNIMIIPTKCRSMKVYIPLIFRAKNTTIAINTKPWLVRATVKYKRLKKEALDKYTDNRKKF